jgi:hypothetical protein
MRRTIQSLILGAMESGLSLSAAIIENGLSVPVVTTLLAGDVEFQRRVTELREVARP